MHNVHQLLSLMKAARNAIMEDRFPGFVKDFFPRYFGSKPPPAWAVDALKMVGINLEAEK
jgi:queuine tRNA-ribosyltransferase catalytic subunit